MFLEVIDLDLYKLEISFATKLILPLLKKELHFVVLVLIEPS